MICLYGEFYGIKETIKNWFWTHQVFKTRMPEWKFIWQRLILAKPIFLNEYLSTGNEKLIDYAFKQVDNQSWAQ
jgi:hypothetical protein